MWPHYWTKMTNGRSVFSWHDFKLTTAALCEGGNRSRLLNWAFDSQNTECGRSVTEIYSETHQLKCCLSFSGQTLCSAAAGGRLMTVVFSWVLCSHQSIQAGRNKERGGRDQTSTKQYIDIIDGDRVEWSEVSVNTHTTATQLQKLWWPVLLTDP